MKGKKRKQLFKALLLISAVAGLGAIAQVRARDESIASPTLLQTVHGMRSPRTSLPELPSGETSASLALRTAAGQTGSQGVPGNGTKAGDRKGDKPGPDGGTKGQTKGEKRKSKD